MEYGIILLRTVVMFAIALAVVRFMGNRAIGQFTPFDFVLMVGIGDIMANVALDRSETIMAGLEALATIGALGLLTSYISLKSKKARDLLEGRPIPIIKDGKILRENMAKAHFNIDDLKQEIHKVGMELSSLDDIKEARLEGCGTFTVIKHQSAEAVTKKDIEKIVCPQSSMQDIRIDQLIAQTEALLYAIKNSQAHKQEQEQEHTTAKSFH